MSSIEATPALAPSNGMRQRRAYFAVGGSLPAPRHTMHTTDVLSRMLGAVWALAGMVWSAWGWIASSRSWSAWLARLLVPGMAWLAGAQHVFLSSMAVMMASGPGGLLSYTHWWKMLSWPTRVVLWPIQAVARPWIEPVLARVRDFIAGFIAPPPPSVPLTADPTAKAPSTSDRLNESVARSVHENASSSAAAAFTTPGSQPSSAPTQLTPLQRLVLRVIRRAGPVPKHIAFIMDGNRRFAKRMNMPKINAHSLGFTKLLEILEACMELGVSVVTVYAFSIENFRRPHDEVQGLMDLAQSKFDELRQQSSLLTQYGIKVKVLGDLTLLSPNLREAVDGLERSTTLNRRSLLNICFPYTSQHEMANAIQRICTDVRQGDLDLRDIDEQAIEARLMTAGSPPVDLLVRTSGETRLSDFLLWQSSKAQLQFEPVLWPDVSFMNFVTMIARYQFAERLWIAQRVE